MLMGVVQQLHLRAILSTWISVSTSLSRVYNGIRPAGLSWLCSEGGVGGVGGEGGEEGGAWWWAAARGWVRAEPRPQWGAVCPACLRALDCTGPCVALTRCQHLIHLRCLDAALRTLQDAQVTTTRCLSRTHTRVAVLRLARTCTRTRTRTHTPYLLPWLCLFLSHAHVRTATRMHMQVRTRAYRCTYAYIYVYIRTNIAAKWWVTG